MKKKPDPLVVLAVIVVIGMLGSSLFSGSKTATNDVENAKISTANSINR